jgi:hypothetical protein
MQQWPAGLWRRALHCMMALLPGNVCWEFDACIDVVYTCCIHVYVLLHAALVMSKIEMKLPAVLSMERGKACPWRRHT